MKMKAKFFLMAGLAIGSLCVSCSDADDSDSYGGDVYYDPNTGSYERYDESASDMKGGDVYGGESGEAPGADGSSSSREGDAINVNDRMSNRLTAGEWNDLDNWKFWTNLLNQNDYYDKTSYWKFTPKSVVAVKVVDADSNAIANVPVELLDGEAVEYAAKTDNSGLAYCWVGLFGDENKDLNSMQLSLKINGVPYEETFKYTTKKDTALNLNIIVNKEINHPEPKADVAFIVDATGSMSDEIDFLISDLGYIIDHAGSNRKVTLRTAALFYRDEDDEYLTRHNDFADDVAVTQKFVSQQRADGGGDYPEAVHTALAESLQKLSWNESARARIAFLILDAPAHHYETVIASLQKSIALYAKNGIKIIPVAASGIDKDTEFMLRFFDIATGGTYVFLTDDSGIGNSHIEASVGDYEVEHLADLMVRLIKKYTE